VTRNVPRGKEEFDIASCKLKKYFSNREAKQQQLLLFT
jgi:hypothetical protein